MEPDINELQKILVNLGYLSEGYTPGELDDATREAIRRFQWLHDVDQTGELDGHTLELLFHAQDVEECAVFGQVLDQVGPVPDTQVTVQDRDLGDAPWPELGMVPTDGNGWFKLLYASEQVLSGDRLIEPRYAIADLIFSVADQPVPFNDFTVYRMPENEPISEDDRLLGLRARRVDEVRIVLQANTRRHLPDSSEYERLLSDFQAVWPNIWPGTLDEEQRREVTFVARELDVARERVVALVSAFQLSRQVFDGTVPPEVLYGLARGEQKLDGLQRLATAGRNRLRDGIYQAMDANLIPPLEDQIIEDGVERIYELAAEQALRQPVAGQPPPGELLQVALPEPAEQVALVRTYSETVSDSGNTLPEFWDALRQQPEFADSGRVEQVQFSLQLDSLTQGYVPLMQALQGELGMDSSRGLLALGRDELTAVVSRPDVGVPATVPDDGGQDRTATYVDTLVGGLQMALPTEAAAQILQQVTAEQDADAQLSGALATFFASATSDALREAGTQFDIRHTPLDAFLADQGEVALAGIPAGQHETVIAQVKRAQRLFRLSTDPDNFKLLLQSGYHSAFDIARIPRAAFIAQNAGVLGNEQQLMMMHNRAVTTSSSALYTYIQLNDVFNGIHPAAVADDADRAAMQEAVAKVLPNWQRLFGAIELCDCAHCRSVYSPAAYLVDLLHFLDQTKTRDGRFTPLDVLLGKQAENDGDPQIPARRPDLGRLRLTCENTNTAIPYVDLVNEVLESLVPALDYGQIAAYDSGDATTAELQATPQYTRHDAYRTPGDPAARPRLDRAVYPPDLPYDQPLEVARVYLNHLHASLAQLKQVLGPAAMSDALAAETLGLSPAGFQVLTGLTLDGDPTGLDVSAAALYGLSPDLLPSLAKGGEGLLVAALKRQLNSSGAALPLAADPATEAFDDATEAAVIAFQQGQGWDGTGTVGQQEWAVLATAGPGVASVVLPRVRPFLQRTALDYGDLTSILAMRFINPARSTFDVLQQLQLPGPDLVAFAEGGLQNPSQGILDALEAAGVTQEDFLAWAMLHLGAEGWETLKHTILSQGPRDQTCDLDTQVLRHWDDNAQDLAEAEWQTLNRLVRLQRALGWSWEDLDVALAGLGATTINAAVIRQLAQLKRAVELLDLSVQEGISLWAPLNTGASGSPYRKRFLSRAALQIDPAFKPDWRGEVLSGAHIGQHVAALRSGLRLRATDLQALRTDTSLDLSEDTAGLDLAAVSHLHRRALLARKLGLAVRDLLDLIRLSGSNPFVAPTDDWALLHFVALVAEVQASGLSVAQLGYLLGKDGPNSPLAPDEQALSNLLETLQRGQQAIAAANQVVDDPTGDLTMARLEVVLEDGQLARRLVQLVRGDDTYAAPLATLPDGLAIPPAWTARLRYDRNDKLLIVRGALADPELAALNGLSAVADYRTAVAQLYSRPRALLADLVAALAGQGLALPGDPAAALLARPSLAATGEMDPKATGQKFAYLLRALLPFVAERQSRTLIKQTLAETLGLEPGLLAVLLEGTEDGVLLLPAAAGATQPAIDAFLALATAVQLDDAALGYRRLHRAALLVGGLELTVPDLVALAAAAIAFLSAPAEAILAFEDLHRLLALASLQHGLAPRSPRLAAVLAAATPEKATEALLAATGWDPDLVEGLVTSFPFALEDFHDPQQLARLAAAVALLQRMGVSSAQAWAWANQPSDSQQAEDVKRAVKARYDDEAWLEVAKTLNNPLRESQKAALISYLLPRLGLGDPNQLYEHLLIDVDMSACMMTSRVKQAISSVQLFIQRCLMNLEPLVAPSAIDAQHWQWMQNYRVWEANRKVFLYPENWIEPELRDDKTPFFRELESTLLQDDVNDESAERALLAYLEKLDEVARLHICAIYVQRGFAPDEKKREVVHIFGHTANSPAIYYYRQLVTTANGTRTWTPWEKIPVDIQGDALAAIVWNRRLYLFWLIVSTKAKPQPAGTSGPGTSPDQYQEYQLAWSEYRNDRWSPKYVSGPQQVLLNDDMRPLQELAGCQDDKITSQAAINRIEARVEGDRLRVVLIPYIDHALENTRGNFCYSGPTIPGFGEPGGPDVGEFGYEILLGSFDREECHGQFLATSQPAYNAFRDGFILEAGSGGLSAFALGQKQDPQVILGRGVAGAGVVEQRWQLGGGDYLVYQDAWRVYLARLDARWDDGLRILDKPIWTDPGKILVTDVPRIDQVQLHPAIRYLEQRSTLAVADSHAWASAGTALSLSTLQTLSLAPQQDRAGGLGGLAGEIVSFRDFDKQLWTDYVRFRGKQSALLTFETLYHPYVCRFVEQLQRYGVPGLLTPANQSPPGVQSFNQHYLPVLARVGAPQPVETLDFGNGVNPAIFLTTAYATYNWELFFHVPLLVATRLSQNQRFEQAQRWYRYIFDPTDDQGNYWKVLPFQKAPKTRIGELLAALSAGDAELQRQVAEWKDHPFQPHLLARMRLSAYQKNVVMKTIDNLIAWGDQLFRRDTIESINQATQLYIMAANLLGPRPQRIPPLTAAQPKTFDELRGKLDALSNAMVDLETRFPIMAGTAMAEANQAAGLLGIARGLYFCIPQNDKLLAYWDTVADRLFKIRHCMNIEGVVRELPLFEPPIEPALLVLAAARGVDLGSVLSDLSAPLPLYRFTFTLQKALDLCNDLRSLGAALQATLEKRDSEALAVLRAKHERALLEAVKLVRQQQVDEADAQITALLQSRAVAVGRYLHYLALTGADNAAEPAVGATIPPVVFNPKPTSQGGVSLIDEELNELNASHSARDWQVRASTMDILASVSHYIPTFVIKTAPFCVGTQIEFGGPHVAPALTAISRYQQLLGYKDSYEASHAGKMATYQRRQQEWALHANNAAREIMQIDKQLIAANIRLAMSRREQANHDLQVENAAAVEEFLHTKYTDEELYARMQGELSGLYFQAYQLAYDLAKRAERCYRFERGVTQSSFVQFGAWDSLRKGLLAGERLSLQLRQMERAYLEQNRREYELTKHVSLLTHAPLALIQLKEIGQCTIDLPETLFDTDYPGHFMRRIKSVSISIPAVAGPYTSVNCTLTLLGNKTRIKSELRNGKYAEDLENEDTRFVTDFAAMQSIATSTAQNDSGLFELSFRDERYLPFEGAGVVSRWRIELPDEFRQFDYDTIADVVLHVKYTAREGGAALGQAALADLNKLLKDEEGRPQARLFSLRHEFPSEWQRLQSVAAANGDHSQAFSLAKHRFPFLFQGAKIIVNKVELFGVPNSREKNAPAPALAVTLTDPEGQEVELQPAAAVGWLVHKSADAAVAVKNLGDTRKEADWTLKVAQADLPASLERLEDILVLAHYSVDMPM